MSDDRDDRQSRRTRLAQRLGFLLARRWLRLRRTEQHEAFARKRIPRDRK